MIKKKLNLSKLQVQSFITAVSAQQRILGGQVCPEQSRALEHCVSAEHMDGCMSTGNTDDPTGLFSVNDPGCLGSEQC